MSYTAPKMKSSRKRSKSTSSTPLPPQTPIIDTRWRSDDGIIDVYMSPATGRDFLDRAADHLLTNGPSDLNVNDWEIDHYDTVTPELRDQINIPSNVPNGWIKVEFWKRI